MDINCQCDSDDGQYVHLTDPESFYNVKNEKPNCYDCEFPLTAYSNKNI